MKKLGLFLGLAVLVASCGGGNKACPECAKKKAAGADATTEKLDENKLYYSLNEAGELIRPKGYRTEFVFVGTPLTPNELAKNGKAAFPEFHNVYIDPVSYDIYKRTGKFRQGTIIIKELVNVGSKMASSGAGYFQGEFNGLEATIKSKELFPDEPGNWAYYSFSHHSDGVMLDAVKPFPTDAGCNGCHASSAEDDFVFTQYYPVLKAAKGFGEGDPEDKAERVALPGFADI